MRPTAGICEDDDELRATPSGREAVRVFSDRPPDVLVLDIGLPSYIFLTCILALVTYLAVSGRDRMERGRAVPQEA